MIPLFRPSCTDLEVAYVTETLRSGWWALGPRVAEFEERFARYVGAAHAVAMNSATMAMQLTLQAILADSAGPDDGGFLPGGFEPNVILPALTFASTGLAALHNGCRVVFADIDEDTLCIDWADVSAKLTPQTIAVIPVWYGGTVVPTSIAMPLNDVIEDAAHAAGSAGVGKLGPACWSFQAVKNLATGDGGMVTTDDANLAATLRRLRWCGIDRSTWDRETRNRGSYAWEYDIREPGHKAHMNDLTAALGLAQLERLDDMNKTRRDLVRRYLDELGQVGWLRLPQWREDSAWHLFVVRVAAEERTAFIDHMLACGVSAGVHYKPLTSYPVLGEGVSLPVTGRVWPTLVTLPLFPDMTEQEFWQVCAAVRTFRP